MDYYLYPPFFRVEPQTSFGKAWEDFCCRLLNLEHQTNEIYVREPPDRGIDLFWPDQGIAYQCKSVESGMTGGLQIASVKASLKKALEYQARIGWRQYVLCTNVNLTGPQEETLLHMYPDIRILRYGYWVKLCRRFHEQVTDRFQLLIQVAPPHIQQAIQVINKRYLRDYLPQLREYSPEHLTPLLIYSNRHRYILELSIPSTFTANEILLMLRELFELPEPKYIQECNIAVSLEHSLHINNKEVAPQQKLSELQVDERPLVTLWKTITWSDNGRQTQTTDLEGTFQRPTPKHKTSSHSPEELAIKQYTREVDKAIDQAIMRFSQA